MEEAKKKTKWPLPVRILAGFLALLMLVTGGLLSLVRVAIPSAVDINEKTIANAYASIRQGDRYLNASAAERVAIFLSNLGREPKTCAECEQIAAACIGREEYGEAIVLYEKSIALDDTADPEASAQRYLRLASLYVLDGNLIAAQKYYETALSLDSEAYTARLLLAQIHLEKQAYAAAERELARYLESRPEDAENRRVLAALAEGMGDYEKARMQYAILAEQTGQTADILGHARLSLQLGDAAGCLRDLTDYMEKEPEPAGEAYYLRGVATAQNGDYERAADDLNKAIGKGCANQGQCYVQLTNLYYLLGNMEGTMAAGQKAEALLDAPDGALLQMIGISALQLGEYETAADYLGRSMDADAALTDSYYFRGVCRMLQERYEAAGADFAAAEQVGTMVQESAYYSAVCSIQSGDHAAARAALRRCIAAGEGTAWAADAAELLRQLP